MPRGNWQLANGCTLLIPNAQSTEEAVVLICGLTVRQPCSIELHWLMENTPILVDRMKKKGKSWRAKKEMASRYSQKGSRPHRNTRSIYSPVYSSPAVPKRKYHNFLYKADFLDCSGDGISCRWVPGNLEPQHAARKWYLVQKYCLLASGCPW